MNGQLYRRITIIVEVLLLLFILCLWYMLATESYDTFGKESFKYVSLIFILLFILSVWFTPKNEELTKFWKKYKVLSNSVVVVLVLLHICLLYSAIEHPYSTSTDWLLNLLMLLIILIMGVKLWLFYRKRED